ncbi:hypothetical protein [Azospirillum sp. TSH64]|uniref:hypothetical protein n=1 Tax=Azospirillum sp. TSH64 TaxID=652740 RepID=UPI0011B23DDB|nr:hypothetical protein [Azospirillum sp. TSH64]
MTLRALIRDKRKFSNFIRGISRGDTLFDINKFSQYTHKRRRVDAGAEASGAGAGPIGTKEGMER